MSAQVPRDLVAVGEAARQELIEGIADATVPSLDLGVMGVSAQEDHSLGIGFANDRKETLELVRHVVPSLETTRVSKHLYAGADQPDLCWT